MVEELNLGLTYQDLQELMSPVLIISDFGGRSGKHLVLVAEASDNDSVYIRHHWGDWILVCLKLLG